jgi:hypothetical protein
VYSVITLTIQEAKTTITTKIAMSFGTNAMVGSWMEVVVWMIPIIKPTTNAVIKMGADNFSVTNKASLTNVITSISVIYNSLPIQILKGSNHLPEQTK